ncbi:hypothetical protein S40293_05948 [Stachybotrys chartarum IBT 40293]|nr:hypothetical protein S40293_05948 [Stachybotrys chartarum IBT 40293]
MLHTTLIAAIPLAFALAMPALAACENYSYSTCEDNIVHWYDPNTGDICNPLPCGGECAGLARTDIPGCPAYSGTEVYDSQSSYLPCFAGPGAATSEACELTATHEPDAQTSVVPSAQPEDAAPFTTTVTAAIETASAADSTVEYTTSPATTAAPTLSTFTTTLPAVSSPATMPGAVETPDPGSAGVSLRVSLIAAVGALSAALIMF